MNEMRPIQEIVSFYSSRTSGMVFFFSSTTSDISFFLEAVNE
jgi:hypothetical protein